MDGIKDYFFTIFKVFLLLSSIFIIFTFIKNLKFKRKNKNRNNLNMRGNNKISMKSENKNNSYKLIDSNLKNDKVYKYDNGDLYKGEFIDGKRQGFGICIFANKERYEGIWKNDLMHSIGKYTYNDGSTYSGDFRNGVAEGIGTYTYKNNDIYKGYFFLLENLYFDMKDLFNDLMLYKVTNTEYEEEINNIIALFNEDLLCEDIDFGYILGESY